MFEILTLYAYAYKVRIEKKWSAKIKNSLLKTGFNQITVLFYLWIKGR